MNKQFAAVVTILLFVTLCFSGCELLEEKPDYITVTCSAEICATLFDENDKAILAFPAALPIRVDFTKAGGEHFTLTCEIDVLGAGQTGTVSFKLYKEQPIEAVMTVQGGYLDFYPKAPVQYQTLTWEVVDAAADFGGVYSWKPVFFVDLYNTTIP